MKKFSKLILVHGCVLFCFGSAYAGVGFDSDNARTFLGPTFRLGYTSPINNDTAFSIAGEGAPKNMRIGGTLGWLLTPQQRIKISAEYLWQDITYSFFSGQTDQWVNQGALGAAYQYDLDYSFDPQFDLSAYASHAPSKSLSTIMQPINNPNGTVSSFIVDRRIAGSNAAGIAPGFTITPWQGGRLSALLNYDWVHYNRKYQSDDDAKGFGGTLGFNQVLTRHMGFGLGTEFRQPYNNYTANLTWSTLPDCGNWVVGLNGNYLTGKESLPDTWNVGLSINYLLDNPQPSVISAERIHRTRDLKGEFPAPVTRNNIVSWTADPAVYMPQVLAVPDQRVTNFCDTLSPIVLLSPLPDFTEASGNEVNDANGRVFNSPTHFSGSNLIYSFAGSVTAPNPPPSPPLPPGVVFVFNPQTGSITLPPGRLVSDTTYLLTITASNGCTSTSASFLVQIDNIDQ